MRRPRRQGSSPTKAASMGVTRVNSQPLLESIDRIADTPAQIIVLPSARELYSESKIMQARNQAIKLRDTQELLQAGSADSTLQQLQQQQQQQQQQQSIPRSSGAASAEPFSTCSSSVMNGHMRESGQGQGHSYVDFLGQVAAAQSAYQSSLSDVLSVLLASNMNDKSAVWGDAGVEEGVRLESRKNKDDDSASFPVASSNGNYSSANGRVRMEKQNGADGEEYGAGENEEKLDFDFSAITNVSLAPARKRPQTFEAPSFQLPPTTPFDAFKRAAAC